MSNRDDFIHAGPRSIQTAYVDLNNASKTTGTGEDLTYWDVTLATTLIDYTKAEVSFEGSCSTTDAAADATQRSDTTSDVFLALYRLTSNTNLRLSSPASVNHCTGRYVVKEWR